ncbi:hypothetical protein B0H14DRAFT_3134731 [Mycena olivaceomarginata]|nr:hypothetical protein B0H14DRAFT_3134731 [Mycena olivaceomarginata]
MHEASPYLDGRRGWREMITSGALKTRMNGYERDSLQLLAERRKVRRRFGSGFGIVGKKPNLTDQETLPRLFQPLVFVGRTMLASGVGIGAAGAGSGPLPPRADILTYNWGFTGSQAGSNLAACATIPLDVFPGSQQSTGVPPYYMMAFPVSGDAHDLLIGTDASALEWTVAFPVGTLLLLGVVDSLGTSGGIDTGFYTVIGILTGGSTTQCIPSDSRPAFTITSNLTSGSTLSTCDGWQLSIQGGMPPYKVTLAPSNSADVVNVTLGPNDSVFSYLKPVTARSQLLAAVSDSTGRWATDGPTVQTSGSKDMTCNGISGGSGPATSSSPVNSPSVSPAAHSGISRKPSRSLVDLLARSRVGVVGVRGGAPRGQYRTPPQARRRLPSIRPFSAMTRDGWISGPAPEMPKGEIWDGRYAHMPVGADAPSMHMTHDSESHITMMAMAGAEHVGASDECCIVVFYPGAAPSIYNANPGHTRQTDGKRNLQVWGRVVTTEE